MNVHFMCAYYSQWAHNNLARRSQSQWDAYQFTRAVKWRTINGFMTFPWITRDPERIDASNAIRARQIFGVFICKILKEAGIRSASIVPVPSKCGLVGEGSYRSLEMVQDALSGTEWSDSIEPIIRFTIPLQKASEGGNRERSFLREHMKLTHYPTESTVVLVDDLVTTGGSLLAAYDVLADWTHPPKLAICCGLTVTDSLIKPFGIHMREYDPTPGDF